jgi:hypothetical protein
VARGEVVRAVENDIVFREQLFDLIAFDARRDLDDFNFRVDGVESRARRFDFPRADRVGAIEDLPLQVGEIDLVGVGQRQPADARRGEIEGRRAAEAAGADDQRGCRAQPFLPLDADLGEQDVPAVAEELLVVQLA